MTHHQETKEDQFQGGWPFVLVEGRYSFTTSTTYGMCTAATTVCYAIQHTVAGPGVAVIVGIER